MAATPRSQGIRGSRVGGISQEPPRQVPYPQEDVADPTRPRHVLDYALARRSVLEHAKSDVLVREQMCDADPYLLRAAKHHGEQTERLCPICARSELVHVTYTYGDDLGFMSGRVHSSSDLPIMAFEYGHFWVYVVEVCSGCGWNHLHISYVLGDGTPRTPPRKPRDVLE